MDYNLDSMPSDRLECDRQATRREPLDRGQDDNVPRLGKLPAPQPIAGAIDRGDSDRTVIQALKNSKPISAPVQMQSSAVERPQTQTDSATELHRRNILRALQRRMRVAQAKGDRQLIQQLEQELQMFS